MVPIGLLTKCSPRFTKYKDECGILPICYNPLIGYVSFCTNWSILVRVERMNINQVVAYFRSLQDDICEALSKIDGTSFVHDAWRENDVRYGDTRIIEGAVFEKGGVNFSYIEGNSLPRAALEHMPHITDTSFIATGVSLVIHPHNPFVPTSHMNVRFFVTNRNEQPLWWFGGGFDLTPVYPFDEDCIHWHKTAKEALHPWQCYDEFKDWCDNYFYLPHRDETRGIGGIFFDRLCDERGWSWQQCFACTQAVGNAYLDAYLPIAERRKDTTFDNQHKAFQALRLGRYVEFNLLYDRGTSFGLQAKGRTESILMSLPPHTTWRYNYQPQAGSPEAALAQYLKPRKWV